jgi:hypothetical protein
MTMDTRRTAAQKLIGDRGAGRIAHPGGTLLGHLERVAALLAGWGAAVPVQLAGLCHAAYSTGGFATALLGLDERPLLAQAIGSGAEQLVYLYASCDRDQLYPQLAGPAATFTDRFTGTRHVPTALDLCAFMEITAANELDVIRHNPELAARHGAGLAALFTEAGQHLSEQARQAWAPSHLVLQTAVLVPRRGALDNVNLAPPAAFTCPVTMPGTSAVALIPGRAPGDASSLRGLL